MVVTGLSDGIGILVKHLLDIFLGLLNFLLKPIMNNPYNFKTEPSAYLGDFAMGVVYLVIVLALILGLFNLVKWTLSRTLDKENPITEAICPSLTIVIAGLLIGSENFTLVQVLGDTIGFGIIFYSIISIGTLVAERL